MFEKVSECPICKGDQFKNELICQDYLASGESFVLTDCQSCGLRITNPRPDLPSIEKYYPEDSYLPHQKKALNLFQLAYRLARNVNLNWKYQLIKGLTNEPGNLLDFGAGTGEFLHTMRTKGWNVHGVEPSKAARIIAHENYKLNLVSERSQLPDNQAFNIISLWHVLEHLHDINNELTALSELLHKGGKLLIAVPNYTSYDATHYAEQWAGFDVPRHLTHFNQKTMKDFLKRNGLKIESVIPMKMDAYYVSILSEKNKKSNFSLFRGLRTGYKSNRLASKNSNNYSSLVYIASK